MKKIINLTIPPTGINKYKMKVKVSNTTVKDLQRLEIINRRKLKNAIDQYPFATVTFLALKTGLSISFIKKHK